jgi:amidase
MASRDPRDPWWAGVPLDGPALPRPIRVALTVDPARQGVNRAVAGAVRAAGLALAEAGYAVDEVEPPAVDGVAANWATLVFNEMRHMTLPYIQKYGGEDLNRCTDLILSGVPDLDVDTYMRALGERTRHIRDWMVFMERYPLVVGPVSTEPPFEVGFDVKDAETTARVLRAQRLLVAVNLLGLPAVSVPCGLTDGIPLGVQVIGGRYREDLCLDAAEVIEARHGLPTPIDPR